MLTIQSPLISPLNSVNRLTGAEALLESPERALGPADFFGIAANPEAGQLAQSWSELARMLQPNMIQAKLMDFALSDSDLTSRALGAMHGDRAELTKRLTSMFEEALRGEGGVEARPGSALAEGTATGDFSHLTPEQLLGAIMLLAAYMQNRGGAGGQSPWGAQGSWPSGQGTSGPGMNAAAPSGVAPTGPAPEGSTAGQKLAHAARGVAARMGTTGRCYAGVADAVAQSLGVQLSGGSAYMAADQLAASDRFKEVSVSPEQLKSLPEGAVVVWGQTDVSPHGHISVALGNGQEASDHVQSQMTSLRGHQNYRVFMPV